VLVQVPQWSPELPGKGVMTMTLCHNNRPPTLSLIPVIYNSLGQNKSKELELWPNNEYEIRPYSFQQISSGPTDSDYKIRDRSRFIEWGLVGEGVWGMEMLQPLVGRWGKAPKTRVSGAEPPNSLCSLLCCCPAQGIFATRRLI